jgi:hypothetical protein
MRQDLISREGNHYRLLAEKLREEFCGTDDETLKDTLDGISRLPEMLEEIIRSTLEDETFMLALKTRIDLLSVRITRFRDRYDKKRRLAATAMANAQIHKFEVADFSVFLNQGHTKLVVVDEKLVPEKFFVPQPARLDRVALTTALKSGEAIDGASLANGDAYIAVRAR